MPSLTTIAVILVALIVAAVIGIGIYFVWSNSGAAHVAVKEQTVAGQAVVAAAQSNAAQQAQTITVQGGARDSLDITLHQANARSVQTAPGANAALDPALNAAGIRGLCAHPAYASNPQCGAYSGVTP
jgi:hypothetical protein